MILCLTNTQHHLKISQSHARGVASFVRENFPLDHLEVLDPSPTVNGTGF